ncbi:hypothetical protein CQ018_08495 [Arthrobacter sp. MYb227]|uniref:hypothetical protein n=1 Tax=Arthrobacter sp. MYb227 TaxID=1848601 RepID=UPI000CFD4EBF|nr:hypothetical protein [Arthrobacter sp. MYb227]PQZ93687.1 hypothetical protein CQ018_08495 [Arthrobacter sp. MYb227]
MPSEESSVRKIRVCVPRLRDVSSREAMNKLAVFLHSIGIDCTLDASERQITYGPDAEGVELEFILNMIEVFDARFRTVPTIEESRELEELIRANENKSR